VRCKSRLLKQHLNTHKQTCAACMRLWTRWVCHCHCEQVLQGKRDAVWGLLNQVREHQLTHPSLSTPLEGLDQPQCDAPATSGVNVPLSTTAAVATLQPVPAIALTATNEKLSDRAAGRALYASPRARHLGPREWVSGNGGRRMLRYGGPAEDYGLVGIVPSGVGPLSCVYGPRNLTASQRAAAAEQQRVEAQRRHALEQAARSAELVAQQMAEEAAATKVADSSSTPPAPKCVLQWCCMLGVRFHIHTVRTSFRKISNNLTMVSIIEHCLTITITCASVSWHHSKFVLISPLPPPPRIFMLLLLYIAPHPAAAARWNCYSACTVQRRALGAPPGPTRARPTPTNRSVSASVC
jgi:hypothetical protein